MDIPETPGPAEQKQKTKKTINNRYLGTKDNLQKLRMYRKVCSEQKIKILNLSLRLARMRNVKQKLSDKISENAKLGDVSAICHNLNYAYEKGCLSGRSKILKFLQNISQNLCRKSKGQRYNGYTKELYDAVRIIGGPRTSVFLAKNLLGPSDNTQRRSKKHHTFKYYPCKPSERVFKHLAELYKSIKASKQISRDVLVETAKDETVIIEKCEWNKGNDQGWGWCGLEGQEHECDPDFIHNVGDGEDAYQRLVEAFRNNRVAGFARVILINPLHADLPPFVVFTARYLQHTYLSE